MRVGSYNRWLEWLGLPIDRHNRCGDGGLEALCDGGDDGGGIALDRLLRGRGRRLAKDGGCGEEEGGDDDAMIAEGRHLGERVVSKGYYRKHDVTIDDDQITVWDASPGLLSCAVGTSILSSSFTSELLYPFCHQL